MQNNYLRKEVFNDEYWNLYNKGQKLSNQISEVEKRGGDPRPLIMEFRKITEERRAIYKILNSRG